MSDLSGYWKGVAVTRTFRVVLHMSLEQTGDQLKGAYEAEDTARGKPHTGALEGQVTGNKVTLTTTGGKEKFEADLVGNSDADFMLFGTMTAPGEATASGTFTLFKGQGGVATYLYKA